MVSAFAVYDYSNYIILLPSFQRPAESLHPTKSVTLSPPLPSYHFTKGMVILNGMETARMVEKDYFLLLFSFNIA